MSLVSEVHLVLEGRALAHAVSHRILNAGARLSSHGSPCAIFDGQGPVHFRVIRFSSVIIPSVLHICSSMVWWMHKALITGHSFAPSQERINCVEERKKKNYPVTGLDRPLGLQEVVALRISRLSAHDSRNKSYLEFVSLGEVCTDLCSVPHRFIYFSLFTLVPPVNCCGFVFK